MAESEQFILQDGNLQAEETNNIVSVNGIGVTDGSDLTDQIIQQALQGVSEPVQPNVVQYTTESGENLTLIANGSVLTDVSGNVVGTLNEDGTTYTLFNNLGVQETSSHQDQQIPDVSNSNQIITGDSDILTESHSSLVNTLTSVSELTSDVKPQIISSTSSDTIPQPLYVIRSSSAPQNVTLPTPETVTSASVSGVLSSFPTSTSAPLGSSQNPIRIIQQGNHYTSTQQLNPDQLTQIMQVIQEQQAVRQAKQMGGPSVVYNPHTQTKIVYRVINPSDLHSKSNISSLNTPAKIVQGSFNEKSYPGKRRGRKRKSEMKIEEEDAALGPELSRKEKEEKKKFRPKTRSGRVSKPPKHMMKDYKQIHLVDWHEDYDDSDGGYSDYRGSEGEEIEEDQDSVKEKHVSEDAYENLRPKKFKCNECGKGYIGRTGLDRHWSKFPDHKGDEGADNYTMIDTEASNDSFVHSFIATDSVGSKTIGAASVSDIVAAPVTVKPIRHIQAWRKNSKRYKLNEMLEKCDEEMLTEVCLPKLASIVSLWEFLLMKIECSQEVPSEIHFNDIHKLFVDLRKKVKHAFQECLGESTDEVSKKEPKTAVDKFELTDKEEASAMGQEIGTYSMKPLPVDKIESENAYAFISANPTSRTQNQSHKRPTIVVSPSSLVSPPLHKAKHRRKTSSDDSNKENSTEKFNDDKLEQNSQNKNLDTTHAEADLNMECGNQDGDISVKQVKSDDKIVSQSEIVSNDIKLISEMEMDTENESNPLNSVIDKCNQKVGSNETNSNDELVELINQLAGDSCTNHDKKAVTSNDNTRFFEQKDSENPKDNDKDASQGSNGDFEDKVNEGMCETVTLSNEQNEVHTSKKRNSENALNADKQVSVPLQDISVKVKAYNNSGSKEKKTDALQMPVKEAIITQSLTPNIITQSNINVSTTVKSLPIVKLELPFQSSTVPGSEKTQVKIVCNTDDLKESLKSDTRADFSPAKVSNESSSICVPKVTVNLPSVQTTLSTAQNPAPFKQAVTSSAASLTLIKSPGILDRLIKGGTDNVDIKGADASKPVRLVQSKVVTLPSCKSVSKQNTVKPVKVIKQILPPNVKIMRIKSGTSNVTSNLISNNSATPRTNTVQTLKNIVQSSPSKEMQLKLSPSRSLIRPTTSTLIQQQKTGLKNTAIASSISNRLSVLSVPAGQGMQSSNVNTALQQVPAKLVSYQNLNMPQIQEQQISFNSPTFEENEGTNVQEGLGQVTVLSSNEQVLSPAASEANTYDVNPDGTLSLTTRSYSTVPGIGYDESHGIVTVGGTDTGDRIVESSEAQGSSQVFMAISSSSEVMLPSNGNTQVYAANEELETTATDTAQQIIINAEEKQQIEVASDESQQVLISDGSHQVLMTDHFVTTAADQTIVMESQENQHSVMETTDPSIVMETDGTQVPIEVHDNQPVMSTDGISQVFMTGSNEQLVLSQESILSTTNDQVSQVVFTSENNSQVLTSTDNESPTLMSIAPTEAQSNEATTTLQTEDGIYLVRNPDGTCQIHSNSDQPIPIETIQALISMAPDQFQMSST